MRLVVNLLSFVILFGPLVVLFGLIQLLNWHYVIKGLTFISSMLVYIATILNIMSLDSRIKGNKK